ncbi:MAG: hypothetical protein H7Z14_01010 [Anaerolineae bacterium]|nr:hypothetical protein [Phycisphaerae bacterium]
MQLRTPKGAAIADVFSFLSGLYFRGKIAYARSFGVAPQRSIAPAYVITSTHGLVSIDTHVTADDLIAMRDVPIDADEPRYRGAIETDVARILRAKNCDANCRFVLLGSIATKKYVDVLLPMLGERLHFPAEFVGRGDMSRGGLMLRAARESRELHYIPIEGATRHGSRPPKLAKIPRSR